jgi:hypothetical protein
MKQSDLISKFISHAGMKEIIWKEEESSGYGTQNQWPSQ